MGGPAQQRRRSIAIAAELARYPQLPFRRPARRTARSQEARDRLYYKTDSHWNYLGASVGYDALMREVQQLAAGL